MGIAAEDPPERLERGCIQHDVIIHTNIHRHIAHAQHIQRVRTRLEYETHKHVKSA